MPDPADYQMTQLDLTLGKLYCPGKFYREIADAAEALGNEFLAVGPVFDVERDTQLCQTAAKVTFDFSLVLSLTENDGVNEVRDKLIDALIEQGEAIESRRLTLVGGSPARASALDELAEAVKEQTPA